MQPELIAAEPVVQEVEFLILDEEGIPTRAPTLRQQDTLCTSLGDHDIGRDAPGPVVKLGGCGKWDRRPARIKDVLVPWLGDGWAFHGKAAADVAIDRQHLVLARFRPPAPDHFDYLVTMFSSQVMAFGVVLIDVVQLPIMGLDIYQHFIGDGEPTGGLSWQPR